MPAVIRQKQMACIACAEGKRKCDKQLPECQRCLDRDVDCVYPQPKRRRRHRDDGGGGGLAGAAPGVVNNGGRLVEANHQVQTLPTYDMNSNDFMQLGLGFGNWNGSLDGPMLDNPLSDVVMPYLPPGAGLLPPTNQLATIGNQTEGLHLPTSSDSTFSPPSSTTSSSSSCPWFLQEDSWVLCQRSHEPGCVVDVQLEAFIRVVEEMLQAWIKNGYTTFIHRRLYHEKVLPTCMQDAFTTIAAYMTRTPAVKQTILQIAEERSAALIASEQKKTQADPLQVGGDEGQDILAHVARVQALFIYEFICLFDGSVRQRAIAERQLPVLRKWKAQMWEAVKRHRWQDEFPDSPLESINPGAEGINLNVEYANSTKLWDTWILTESARRTHLIVDNVGNMYKIMTEGWAECTGGVLITARRGLWEADSAVKWNKMCSEKSPLLVPSLHPEELIAQYHADDFDDFIKLYWTFIVGTDKIQCWIDKGADRRAVAG